jgi:adenylate cyclase
MKSTGQRPLVVSAICLGSTLLVLLLAGFVTPRVAFTPLLHAEFYAQDWMTRLGRKTPANTNLVLVGIDRPAYDDVIFADEAADDPVLAALRQRFPDGARIMAAALIERLAAAGARAVVIDLVFAAPAAGDERLKAALERHRDRVVIGCNIADVETDRGWTRQLTPPAASLLAAAETTPAVLDARVGFVNIWADDDGVLRRARLRASNEQLEHVIAAPAESVMESLAARALRHLGEPGRIPVGLEAMRFRFTAPPGDGFKVHSVADVLTPKLWAANYGGGEFFRGKLVLVGPTANIFQDFHRTPFAAPMLGPEIHLNILNAALHGEFLRELPGWSQAALVVLGGLIAALLCQAVRQPLRRIGELALISVGYVAIAQLAHDRLNLVLTTVSPLLVMNFSGIAALGYDFIVERLERMKLRHTMSLYFSPKVLEAVLSNPGSMEPRQADVTLLLTDLRNSTPLAEALGPRGMFDLLNRVFEVQTSAIMSEEGNLEHFLGDQFLSYWGAPKAQADAADRALRAANKLITAMEELRATLPPAVQELFGYGVALHCGPVLCGNKGSRLRLDYGLVGDTVNEAARIESLTKLYGVRLLLSRDVFARTDPQTRRRLVDRVIVKGKTEPVELFEVANPCTPPAFAAVTARYEAAYDEYFFGRFAAARELFEKLAQEFDDGPSRCLAVRCAELMRQPPARWDGIWRMDSK